MFNFLIKSDSDEKTQKKLVSLSNAEVFNGLVRDEAMTNNTNDSAVIENIVLAHFLNEKNDDITYSVVDHLYNENGISEALRYVFNIYAACPSKANDTLLPLLDYIKTIEARSITQITGKEPVLHHFKSNLESMIDYLKHYREQCIAFGQYPISNAELLILEDIDEFVEDNPRNLNEVPYFSQMVGIIQDYWNKSGEEGNVSLENWSTTYRILSDLCTLSKWPCLPQYRNELVHLLKNVTVTEGEKDVPTVFDVHSPILKKPISLKSKILITTEDAVMIYSGNKSAEYEHVKLIIHGPNGRQTRVPYFILFNDETPDELKEIIYKSVKKFKDEFPDNHDAYAIPIYEDGQYYDSRVKCKSILM